MAGQIDLGRTKEQLNPVTFRLPMSNRHGLIAGATGTGKTVTLQRLAEQFSRQGVPVFLADVKGDLTGISQPRKTNPKLQARLAELKQPEEGGLGCPTMFWDLWGKQGHPLRTTISEVGPALLSRLMELNEVQTGVLNLSFKVADDAGLLMIDLKDLRAVLHMVSERAKDLQVTYGQVSSSSVGAIQRALLEMETQGANVFFGEPAFEIMELLRTDLRGQGFIHLLAADQLLRSPKLYSTFLLWLMSELFENLPEVGDLEKPKLVFFFDEAHLLFKDAPSSLVDKIEQVVRLIRSKGVGIYFVTQNPLDLPNSVLGQLGHRVQHALRAFTPADQKSVKSAAQTMSVNKSIDTESLITSMGVGEALVSVLDEQGRPTPVEYTVVAPPLSQLGPITPETRTALMNESPVRGKYDVAIDRESAFEKLNKAVIQEAAPEGATAAPVSDTQSAIQSILFGSTGPRGGQRDGLVQTAAKSAVRTMANQVGRELLRGLLGGITGGSSPRRRRR